MGTPIIRGDVSGSISEGDISVSGDLDDVGYGTGSTDDFFKITAQSTYGTASIDSSTGTWTYTLNNSDPTVKALDPGEMLTDIFRVSMLDTAGAGSGHSYLEDVTITIHGVICFVGGTLIETSKGPQPVETLKASDLVLTHEGQYRPVRWAGHRSVGKSELAANPKLFLVRIRAGALGSGLPRRDLLVSRQHRMLVQSRIAERVAGTREILVPAIKLVEVDDIEIETDIERIEYYHLLLDTHEIILAEGAPSESLHTGFEALNSLGSAERQEVLALFPHLVGMHNTPETVRPVPPWQKQKRLIARHLKNARPLLEVAGDG